MKRYLLFSSQTYYSKGGWNDFCESFDSVKDAANKALSLLDDPDIYANDWAHVVDYVTASKILKIGSPALGGSSQGRFFVAMDGKGEVLKSWSSEEFYSDAKSALQIAIDLIEIADKRS